jgi:proline dehydrogenase
MDLLGNFYRDSATRETLREFMLQTLGDIAIEKTFNGQNVGGIKEAKELVDRIFDKLEDAYGKIEKPIISNSR